MNIGFIGAGKAGFSLGKYFAMNGIGISGYYSRNINSAKAAAEFTGSRFYTTIDELLKESDALFLTVPDGAIRSVFEELTRYEISGKQICHCSGVMTSEEAFPNIDLFGAYGYSIHPLFPFGSKLESYREMAGAFFCIEGSEAHLSQWKGLLEGIGLSVQIIPKDKKVRYHAACAVASNLVCALVGESLELLESCGFSRERALDALTPLIRVNTENILRGGPIQALTGAVERCDRETVEKHLSCFPTDDERELYRYASLDLLKLAKSKNPKRDYTPLELLLKEGSEK